MQKITVVTHWYNEELLAPLFCNHYRDADEIHILLQDDTNDNTEDICSMYPNVVIEYVKNDGMDNAQALDDYNKAIANVDEGWVYIIDADEFMFPEHNENPQEFLSRQKADVINCLFFHVYRHKSDADIDYSKDPIPQRVHAMEGGPEHKNWFLKPSVLRASAKVELTIGNHRFVGDHTVSDERYIGAHWKQADPTICIKRRMSNKARHSANDHKRGWGYHDFHVTEEGLMKQLEERSDYPVLKYLTEWR